MSSRKIKSSASEAEFTPPASFEDAVIELESLVSGMDSKNMALEQLLTDYKRGAFLVKYCRDRLSQVRKEVAHIEQELQNTLAKHTCRR